MSDVAWPAASRPRSRPLPRGVATGAAMALLLLWILGLGAAPLFDVDEGAFAEASREMLASGDWGHTTLNGADRFDKPILVYWLQAAAIAMLGADEFAVRLPSALCAWLTCLVIGQLAADLWGRRAGWIAAALPATMIGPVLVGRAATADALLHLLLALIVTDVARCLAAGTSGPPAHDTRPPRLRVYAWIGLGLLAKGPIAVVLPAAGLILWALADARSRHRAWQLASDLRGWALAAAIAGPWYAHAVWRHGQAFIDGFVVRHHLERFGTGLEGHVGHAGYPLLALAALMLPWTPCVAWLLVGARRDWADPVARWLLAWSAFVLVFFAVAATKLPHYALYAVSPLVLLVARGLALRSVPVGLALLVVAMAATLVLAGAALPLWADTLAAGVSDPLWVARLRSLAGGPLGPLPLLGLVLGFLCGSAAVALQSSQRRPVALLAASAVSVTWVVHVVVPAWGAAQQQSVRDLALEARRRELPLVAWSVTAPSAAYYRQAVVPPRAPQDGEAALLPAHRLAAARNDVSPRSLEVLASRPDLVLVRLRAARTDP